MALLSESSLSQASTKVGDELKDQEDGTPHTRVAIRQILPSPMAIRQSLQSPNAQDVLLFLIAFRILNALALQTFFQPDEYFQSLEPAWKLAFAKNSGAWITWVSVVANALVSAR